MLTQPAPAGPLANRLDIELQLDTAVNAAMLAAADLEQTIEKMPADVPLFALLDVVRAVQHLRQAVRLVDRAGAAIAHAGVTA